MTNKRTITMKAMSAMKGRKVTRVQVKCCGRWLTCHGFTNTCECGADFNMSGDRLAPRSQWGEETGESAADIMLGLDAVESMWAADDYDAMSDY